MQLTELWWSTKCTESVPKRNIVRSRQLWHSLVHSWAHSELKNPMNSYARSPERFNPSCILWNINHIPTAVDSTQKWVGSDFFLLLLPFLYNTPMAHILRKVVHSQVSTESPRCVALLHLRWLKPTFSRETASAKGNWQSWRRKDYTCLSGSLVKLRKKYSFCVWTNKRQQSFFSSGRSYQKLT